LEPVPLLLVLEPVSVLFFLFFLCFLLDVELVEL
jgi:hypothetical protein